MILIHHLRVGRSIFTVWLLEELGLDYQLKEYHRHPETRRAPPELGQAHPLGKSPVIEDDGLTVAESGAIAAYLTEIYDTGHALAPAPGAKPERARFLQWLHYPEGSAFMPTFAKRMMDMTGEGGPFLTDFFGKEATKQLDFIAASLGEQEYILGAFSAADPGVAFILSMCEEAGLLGDYPTLTAYVARCRARPAFKRALERAVE